MGHMRSVCPFGLNMKVLDFCRRYYARNIYVFDSKGQPLGARPLTMDVFLDLYGDMTIDYFQVVSKNSVLVNLRDC